jgi:hypothetical protein
MSEAIVRRLRITTPEVLPPGASEGAEAMWWREHTMGLSRPSLATLLGISAKTVEREESGEQVSTLYRLACAALNHGQLDDWAWKRTDANRLIRVSTAAKKNEIERRIKEFPRGTRQPLRSKDQQD